MALPKYTEMRYRVWHYSYLVICTAVFVFLIAPLFVIIPLSFNAEQYIHFSDGMLALQPEAFSLRWYEDMIYGTKILGESQLETVFITLFSQQLEQPYLELLQHWASAVVTCLTNN